ncbi:hypothetical protein NUT31_02120 [Aeromonas sp. BC14]|uniref:hypothetical protein n=1 Tax=Aeromonas TaxID=642 RepID=UPI0012E77B5A|nr:MULTISPECIES: hypothetical protein [Aeromonas]MCV3275077.1 hypothetical protein [Aeromonas hydrophila]MDF5703552.1 hypothetical protein [Aeromonas hydrophila subsp. hydrophila]WAF95279.1 hypothetical protein NUT31_02120 [Aeromonas sp. BC14]
MKKARQRARFFMHAVYRQSAGNSNLLSMSFWTRLAGQRCETRVPNNGHKKTDAWASVFHYPVC